MRPLVVLVHGSLSSAHEWGEYAGLLPDAEVVTLDLPGHGTQAHRPFTMAAALELIEDAVAQSMVGQPVILAGHSLGGYLAYAFAARYPGRLDGLVLIGASGDPRSRLAQIYRGYAWLVERVDHRRLARIRDAVARRIGLSDDQIPDASAYAALPAAWRAVMNDCPPELLAHIDCPVLLLNGQFDQMRLTERRYLQLAATAQLKHIPGATHLAPMTHPAQVAAAVWGFAQQVLAPVRGNPLGQSQPEAGLGPCG